MEIEFTALDTKLANHLRAGGQDAYGAAPIRMTSDGNGNPCRHCMCDIEKGRQMLLAAHRPFASRHAYAETGPILLCAESCQPFGQQKATPAAIASRSEFILRGYDHREAIIEGTGKVTATTDIPSYLEKLFEDERVDAVHIRSATNNCFFCKAVAARG